jgi:hypothetical protein
MSDDCIAILPSGKTARFPNIHIAKAMLVKQEHNNIFASADDIYNKLTHEGILAFLRKYHPNEVIPIHARADALEAARLLWSTVYEQADHLFKEDKRGKLQVEHRKDPGEEDQFILRTYWCLYTPGKDPQQDASFLRLTPQARQCLTLILDLVKPGEIISEEKLFKAFTLDKKHIHTKQDKWRIFKYYRSQLVTKNFIRMKG